MRERETERERGLSWSTRRSQEKLQWGGSCLQARKKEHQNLNQLNLDFGHLVSRTSEVNFYYLSYQPVVFFMQLSWPIYLLRPGDALHLQMHSFWSKGCRKGTDVESLYWCHNSHRILTRLCPWGLKNYYLLHVPHINTTICGCVSAKMQKCNRIHSVFISFLLSYHSSSCPLTNPSQTLLVTT